ncbi:MAG: glutamate--tRNA ligase [Patescibacteria group bacterium]
MNINGKTSNGVKKIRVRFAPSPTGYLHIGGARTALYNFLFARKNKGNFILRIEDTDRVRLVEGSLESLLKSLKWLGLDYDEGPYIQSERLEIYQKYARELVRMSKAYYCFCEPERLQALREEQASKRQAPMYDQYCLQNISEEQINQSLKENCPHTIRLKIPKNETVEFTDAIRGKVKIDTNTIDDQILLKSDGYPTYHLANIVDDHLMEITHVIRGDEWIPSTPKHILLYRAFDWTIPEFAHLPLLLNADRSKLSKRQGDVSLEDYVKRGYLKEALINFIALLGWNPGEGSTQEIFSLEELIEKFDLSHVHKGGAVFDLKKLNWLNSEYIKKLSLEELYEKSLEFFQQKNFYQGVSEEKKSEEYLKKVLAVEQDRLNNLSEVGEHNKFFFQNVDYPRELLKWKDMSFPDLKNSLDKSKCVLEKIDQKDWTKENLEKALLKAAGEKRGDLLWPLRAALTGEQKSPSPFEVAWVLGREESLKRLDFALNKASGLK